MKSRLALYALLALAPVFTAFAQQDANELLEPEKAFAFSASVRDAQTIEAKFDVADGYYMYRSKISFELAGDGATLKQVELPAGTPKHDEFFGDIEIYKHQLAVALPVERSGSGEATVTLRANSQGCNEPVGVCYPPLSQEVTLTLPAVSAAAAPVSSLAELRNAVEQDAGQSAGDFLEPDQAFALDVAAADGNTIEARFRIAEGYYLYRDKMKFALEGAELGELDLPAGEEKMDEFFGKMQVYHNDLSVRLPVVRAGAGAAEVKLTAEYQGCAEAGICYPPIKKTFTVALPAAGAAPTAAPVAEKAAAAQAPAESGTVEKPSYLWAILGAFGVGVLLTFTPCVLPMIPILSSIIVGQGGEQITKLRGGMLSASYVLGTAVTYTAAGVLAGATGEQLQAYFQNAWALGSFAVILAVLALSMFGFYEIQMPSFVQSRLQEKSQGMKGGSFVGVFILGMISALIVGACVSPLLISLLALAIAAKDAVLGGAIMFSMAMGMGVFLVAIGVGAGFLLPKAGMWMEKVKYVFGVLLLAVAIYLLGILPDFPALYLWAALLIVTSVYLGATQALPEGASGWRYLWKGVGLLMLVWGVLALIGAMAGNRDIMRPVSLNFGGGSAVMTGPATQLAEQRKLFEPVATLGELDARLADARAAGKSVVLDFYADWCTDCLRMEKGTFTDPRVAQVLSDRFVALKVDVTDPNDPDSKAIKQRYGVFGPPAMLFFSASGEPLKQFSFYGYKNADDYLAHLAQIN
jgi:thiol:disulfide interchange protein DsbD